MVGARALRARGLIISFINIVRNLGNVAEAFTVNLKVRAGIETVAVRFINLNNLIFPVNGDCALIGGVVALALGPIIIGYIYALSNGRCVKVVKLVVSIVR